MQFQDKKTSKWNSPHQIKHLDTKINHFND